MRLSDRERREEYDAILRGAEELQRVRRDAELFETRAATSRREAAEQHGRASAALQEMLTEHRAEQGREWQDLAACVREHGLASLESFDRGFEGIRRDIAGLQGAVVALHLTLTAGLAAVESLLQKIARGVEYGDDFKRFLALKRNALQLAIAEDWSRSGEQANAALRVRDRQGLTDDRVERDPQLHLLLAGRIVDGSERERRREEAASHCETAYSRACVSGERDDLQAGAEAARLRAFLARVQGDYLGSVAWAERSRKMEPENHAAAHLELLAARTLCQAPELLAREVVGATWLWPGFAQRLFCHPAAALDRGRFERLQAACSDIIAAVLQESTAVAQAYSAAWRSESFSRELPTESIARQSGMVNYSSVEASCATTLTIVGALAAADRLIRNEQMAGLSVHLTESQATAQRSRRELEARARTADERLAKATHELGTTRVSGAIGSGLSVAIAAGPVAVCLGLCSSLFFGDPEIRHSRGSEYPIWRPLSAPFESVVKGTLILGVLAAAAVAIQAAREASARAEKLRVEAAAASLEAASARRELPVVDAAMVRKANAVTSVLRDFRRPDLDGRFVRGAEHFRNNYAFGRDLDVGGRVFAEIIPVLGQLAEPERTFAFATALRQARA